MPDEEYSIVLVSLPGDIRAAVRVDPTGWATIYINDRLSPEGRRRALEHELRHIRRDDWFSAASIWEVEQCPDRKNKS